jgi:hypothetical protein
MDLLNKANGDGGSSITARAAEVSTTLGNAVTESAQKVGSTFSDKFDKLNQTVRKTGETNDSPAIVESLSGITGTIKDRLTTKAGDLRQKVNTQMGLPDKVDALQAKLDKLKGKVDANNEMYITLLELLELLTTTIQIMNREFVFKGSTGQPTKDGINNNIPKMQALVEKLRSPVG